MTHRPPSLPASPSALGAPLEDMLTLLGRGVHVLPFVRPGDGALYVVAINDAGEAVCDTPREWPLSPDVAAQINALHQQLDEEWPRACDGQTGAALDDDAALVSAMAHAVESGFIPMTLNAGQHAIALARGKSC